MKKIDFTNVKVYTGLDKKTCMMENLKEEFANLVYTKGVGLKCHALAYKIFNSKGEESYNEEECEILKDFAGMFTIPAFIDALHAIIDGKE